MAHVETRAGRARPYRVRYRGPDGRERSRSFKRKADADRYAATQGADLIRGAWVDPALGKILLEGWLQVWWPTTVDLRPSTRARDESYTRNHIIPRFGRTPLAAITQPDVQAWVADLTSRGLAPATVKKIYQLLARMMAAAVSAGRLVASPCRDIRLPRVEVHEMMFCTPQEIDELADAIEPRYRALVLLGAYAGPRRSELFGLRRARVEVTQSRISISEILVEVNGKQLFGPPKTRAGIRRVPVPPSIMAAVNDHLGEHVGPERDALVFTAPKGGPLRGSLFRGRVWQPGVARAGLDGLRLHDLRHTAVALWIASGADVKQIQRWAGHTSAAVVFDRYGHILPDREDRVMGELEALRAAAQARPKVGARAEVIDISGH